MKKIGIDARLYYQTGVGVYLRNLISEIGHLDKENQYYLYIRPQDKKKIEFPDNFIIRYTNAPWHSFAEQWQFYWQLMSDRLDLMHFTYFSYPILYKKPYIATVHDITPLLFKTGKASTKNPIIYWIKHKVFCYVLKSQIYNSEHVITPTIAVKDQILSIYKNIKNEEITSIYEGINQELLFCKTDAKQQDNPLFQGKFMIYVGNFYPHKNVENLIRAFSIAKTQVKLLLIGPHDHFSNRILNLIKAKNQEDRIKLFDNATIQDLTFAYKNAVALIHPSRSEGFGLPIVEAMHFDLPIIASNIPVFQELMENQNISFDPNNINEMAEKISEFIKQDKQKIKYNNMIRFSFLEMAKKTLVIYKKILYIN